MKETNKELTATEKFWEEYENKMVLKRIFELRSEILGIPTTVFVPIGGLAVGAGFYINFLFGLITGIILVGLFYGAYRRDKDFLDILLAKIDLQKNHVGLKAGDIQSVKFISTTSIENLYE